MVSSLTTPTTRSSARRHRRSVRLTWKRRRCRQARCTGRSMRPSRKATTRPAKQFRVFLTVESERYGVNVRLKGQVFPNLQTGQLTAVVKENPQATFSSFQVHITGGPRGALTTPDTCGPHKTTTALTPWRTPPRPRAANSPSTTKPAAGPVRKRSANGRSARPTAPAAGDEGGRVQSVRPARNPAGRRPGDPQDRSDAAPWHGRRVEGHRILPRGEHRRRPEHRAKPSRPARAVRATARLAKSMSASARARRSTRREPPTWRAPTKAPRSAWCSWSRPSPVPMTSGPTSSGPPRSSIRKRPKSTPSPTRSRTYSAV